MGYNSFYYAKDVMPNNDVLVLDFKQGDVTGDRVTDNVFLVGNKASSSPFVENITLIIQNGRTNSYKRIVPKINVGYNPTIFLGDFTGNNKDDILVSIASGGSGGFQFYYLYSFIDNDYKLIFDHEKFNNEYTYKINYLDNYRVEVISNNLGIRYIVDLEYKGQDYLDEIYDNGKLKEPIEGFSNPIGGLEPIDYNRDGVYELNAIQKIAGRFNADSLGYVETILEWGNEKFLPTRQQLAIFGKEV